MRFLDSLCQHIAYDELLLIGPSWTNFKEISISIFIFSFEKIYFKMSSAKHRPYSSCFCVSKCRCRTYKLLDTWTSRCRVISRNITDFEVKHDDCKVPKDLDFNFVDEIISFKIWDVTLQHPAAFRELNPIQQYSTYIVMKNRLIWIKLNSYYLWIFFTGCPWVQK